MPGSCAATSARSRPVACASEVDLADRLLAADVRERRDARGLEQLGEIVGDPALVLDEQHGGRPRLDDRGHRSRQARPRQERLLGVDRAALGADQVLQEVLDHRALVLERGELAPAVLLPLADPLHHRARGRRALDEDVDHVAGACAQARDQQLRGRARRDHDRQRVRQRRDRAPHEVDRRAHVLDLARARLAQVEHHGGRRLVARARLRGGLDLVDDRDRHADADEPIHQPAQGAARVVGRDQDDRGHV